MRDPVSRYRFIEAEKVGGRSVNRTCVVLQVSRAAYYEWKQPEPSQRVQEDRELAEEIKAVHTRSRGTYGSPRVHRELRQRGVRCGRKRVERLMRDLDLEGRAPR